MVWMVGILLALGTSCSKDMDETPARTIGQVTVNIASQSNLQTRTSLPVHNGEVDADWVQGVQHVTDVYLYVFEQDEDKNDFTCRSMYDVRWSESVDRTEDGKLPTTTSSINYTIAYNFVVGKTYRLVAVGLDCAENVDEMQDFDGHNSALTYGLPESIQPGNKLSQAIATLQADKTTEDIMHSEFFVGEIEFSPLSYESGNIGTVELFRRVAGLQVCLDGIPEEVEQIRVLLYNSQNTQTYLLKIIRTISLPVRIMMIFITKKEGFCWISKRISFRHPFQEQVLRMALLLINVVVRHTFFLLESLIRKDMIIPLW